MTVKIKICGITDIEAARAAAVDGVTHLGFVFAKSRRRVDAGTVRAIGEQLPRHLERVGVFVDCPLEELVRIGQEANLTVYQLHGDESPEMCRILKEMTGKEVWKAWRVRHQKADQQVERFVGAVDAILLDSYRAGQQGGTGKTFPWECIPEFRQRLGGIPLFVAGGLNAENVSSLTLRYRPDGVDVSSGVEHEGKKCSHLIERFVRKAREGDERNV
jgi:phosphoribosylanthranilate isomerase